MKKLSTIIQYTLVLSMLTFVFANAGNIKSAGVYGKWSATTTWVGGVVPGAADIVTIADNDTVTYDMLWPADYKIAGLTVGEGASGVMQFSALDSTKLTITGDLLITKGAIFKALTKAPAVVNVFGNQHLIVLSGNLTYLGKLFDTRIGSAGSTLSVINFEFVGTTNSTVKIVPDTSKLTVNFEFNGWKINKSGTANVVLESDVILASGSSSAAYHSARVQFVKGKIVTGNYAFLTTTATNDNFSGASDSSYVIGAMARANASGGANREWFIGDTKGYRPVKVRMTSASGGTGHFNIVRAIEGNANTGTSTFTGNIDKLSTIRYYKFDYQKGTITTASVTIDRFSIGYGTTDGIKDSTRNLRIAYSTNARAAWVGLGPVLVPDTAIFAKLIPRYLTSDSLAPANVLTVTDGGASLYFAFARATGSTDNTLGVKTVSTSIPEIFSLAQNYPNPFNPSTTVGFQVGKTGHVSLKVYNALGQQVAVLVNNAMSAGTYSVEWNASEVSSGLYFYTLQSGSYTETKKMMLTK